MRADLKFPSPADQILSRFVDGIHQVMPGIADGIYITGSLALNDYQPGKSDIDFLVLCREVPGVELAKKLELLHRELSRWRRGPGLSGSYIDARSLYADPMTAIPALAWHEGRLRYRPLEMAPIHLYELKTKALVLHGAHPSTLPATVSRKILNRAMHENINSYWPRWAEAHDTWRQRKALLLCFPFLTEWAVLGTARQLCTLERGEIVSKSAAGHFALSRLPPEFHPVIRQALAIRRVHVAGLSGLVRPSFRRLRATLDCMHATIDLFNDSFPDVRY